MPRFFKRRSWCETVVWLMLSMRERSVTHISEMASADSMRTRVGSANIEKNMTTLSKTSPSGTYSRTRSAVLPSNNIVLCMMHPL